MKLSNCFSLILVSIFIIVLTASIATGQSGRGRKRTETTQPPPEKVEEPKEQQGQRRYSVPPGSALAQRESDGVTSRFVLKNGLTVIIHEDHSVPLATVVSYVKTGYLDETDDVTGIAHLTEHMLLKGAPTRPAGAVAAEMRALSGVLNGSTSYDRTLYYSVVPATQIEKAIAIQADALLRPTLNADELKKEALVVAQEARHKFDDPTTYALERLYATAFSQHRLKRWPVGTEEGLKAITSEQIQSFYNNFYVPSNIILVVAGGVGTFQVLPAIQYFYGQAKPGTVSSTASPEEPPQQFLRYANERGDLSRTIVSIGYHVPGIKSKQAAALELLAVLLGQGRGARLNRALHETRGVVTEVAANYLGLADTGFFTVQMQLDPKRIDSAEAAFFEEIERFRRLTVSDGELQRAKAFLEKQIIDRMSTISGKAQMLAYFEAARGGYKLASKYIDQIQAVTAEQIQQVAAQYLTLNNATVHEYEPRSAESRTFIAEKYAEMINILVPSTVRAAIEPNEIKEADEWPVAKQGNVRGAQTETRDIIINLGSQPVRNFSTLRGPKAFVREDHSQPRIAVGLYFQGGRLLEDQNNNGLTELMLRMLLKGTAKLNAAEIAIQLEQLGGEIHIVNEPDFFGYTLDILSRNAEEGMRLLLDIIESPFFDSPAFDKKEFARELAREKEAQLADIKKVRDSNWARPLELFWQAVFPNHPYGFPRYGSEAAIAAATEETIKAWYEKSIKRQLPVAMIVGDTDGSALVSRFLADGFRRRDLDKSFKATVPSAPAAAKEQVEQRERQQTAQAVGFVGPKGDSADNFALDVIQSFTSGPGGRFLGELRDKQGLAYTVRTFNEPRFLSGAFICYLATSPENEQAARSVLENEFKKLAEGDISDAELERGKAAAIGSYNIAMQSHVSHALQYARAFFFGRQVEDVDAYQERIRSISKDDVKRVASSYFKLNQRGLGQVRGTIGSRPAVEPGAAEKRPVSN